MTARWPFDAFRGDEDRPPTAAELRDEEAELARVDVFDPLSPAQVDSLVHRALREQRVRCFTKRRLLVAAMLLCTLASVAWMGARVVWAEGKRAPKSLVYATAVLAATDPTKTEMQVVGALTQIDERCRHAAKILHSLAAQSTPAVSARAHELIALVQHRLSTKPTTAPEPVMADPRALWQEAEDATLPDSVRVAALAQLEDALQSGVTAILVAQQLRIHEPARIASANAIVARLQDAWRTRD